MTEGMSTAEVSGRALLIKWATDQDDWVREIVATVLDTNAGLGADDVEVAYRRMLVEKKLEPGTRGDGVKLVDHSVAGPNDPPLALVSIEAVRNVNALAAGQSITFNSKLTVIFGRNGSGKTGYSRILKRLSSVRSEQKILPDISVATPAKEPPTAKICYRLADTQQTLDWAGAAGVAPFGRVDVFDAQDAPTYVDGDLTYVYAPTDVALFRHVAVGIDGVRIKLEETKRTQAPGPNVFLSHFKRTLPFYSVIDTLGATTDIAALKAEAVGSDDDHSVLEGLKETIEALSGQSMEAQLSATKGNLDVCVQAKLIIERLRSFDAEQRDATSPG